MMVALPQITSPTIEAIDAWHADQQDASHYPYIRGSQIGHACERHLWYLYRWACPPQRFDGRMIRLFETGHRDESRMIRDLQNAGIAVQTSEPGKPGQIEVEAVDGHFRGHLDGIATGIKEAPKTPHLLECKTHNAKSFAQLVKAGVAVAKPEHVAQMQVYMHLRGLTRAFYLAKCKDDERLYAERIHYDPAHGAALIAKAERIKAANSAPERVSENPGYFLCHAFNCASYSVCHGSAFALRNCRTCLHSDPVEGGKWRCARHQHELSRADQEQGCPNHLYLPSLVPGEQIDADERVETVTYQLRDGSTWIDGAHREGRAAA